MILIDTSVWVDHLRAGDKALTALLNEARVVTHSFVIGELACGNLRNRTEVLRLLRVCRRRRSRAMTRCCSSSNGMS